MKKIISCLLLVTLLLASVIAMIPASAAEAQEQNVMLSEGTKENAADRHFAGEGDVFYYDYLKYVKNVNEFPMDAYKADPNYVIRYGISGSGSASATDGVKTESGFSHNFSDTKPVVDNMPEDTYNQIFGYSFRNSVMVDGIKIYLPDDTNLRTIDVYGASADVANEIYAFESEKILLASFTDVHLVTPQQLTDAEDNTVNVIVIEETEFTEALKIDYIIFGVTAENSSYGIYEIELNGLKSGYADFTALKEQIAEYKEIAPYYSNYTSDSWGALEDAFNTANMLNKDASSTQSEINTVANVVKNAIDNLEIDKSALNEAIATAKTKIETDYTPNSWEPFAEMLDTALAAQANDQIVPDALAEIVQSLMDAMNYLEPRANFATIDAKLNEIESLKEADYSTASWANLQAVVNKIPTAKANLNFTQGEADALLGELTTAINSLKPPADLTALESKLAEASELKEEEYIPETWEAFQAIIAKAVAVTTNSSTTQADVDAAIAELEDGMKNVLKKLANKTALQTEVTAAKKLKRENYDTSDLTWNVFNKSIEDAEDIIDNPNATQTMVDDALQTLKTNITKLGEIIEAPSSSGGNKKPATKDDEDDETDVIDDETESETLPTTQPPATQEPATQAASRTSGGRCSSSVVTTSVVVAIVATLGSAVVIKKKD